MNREDDAVDARADEETSTASWWGYLGGAAIAVGIAVACFTPLWGEVASGSGKRAGFVGILTALGPVGVAGVSLVVAVILVVVAFRVRSRSR
ncbi:hypothetical protein MN032_03780 [Agromyces atrinae]|uniref:hypothetical protein n=1 Tax=Agromyces atrinae TaxID=592376 RepID=UPI001F55F868|nr:hypothetical protein [Agromyces atrinae]MCI2956805.1 hypothetical protein [Agromyces atrinae]